MVNRIPFEVETFNPLGMRYGLLVVAVRNQPG